MEDQVVATLSKDGEVIKRIVGLKMHNKWWHEYGLNTMGKLLRYGASVDGGSATGAGKIVKMRLGSQCSDTAFTYITGEEEDTTNTHFMSGSGTQVTFTSEWAAAGAIDDICQALLRINNYDMDLVSDAACYNFGTQFDKPDGVSLKIEWTTTLSPA
ncbi:unnamed protein product [marine sediment metagenome]|uniref:Uncharacterized protein n=1 Tax=marine sediment metagenome TaxID=412755 RepID=X0V1Z6_9ZZZZ